MGKELAADIAPTLEALQQLITTLRGENGCPWDRKQTPATIANYLIEEIYELVEAITADDTGAIRDELGDVLFQVMFIVELYGQQQRFSFEAVLERIIGKMIRRHPHVFGSRKVDTAGQVRQQWHQIKQQERDAQQSLLDSVPSGLPALMRSYRVSERAARTGFDWTTLKGVMDQAEAEWTEFKAEVLGSADQPPDPHDVAMEFGDVLFTLTNVARLAGIHPETALSQSTQKFIRRFQRMEAMAARHNRPLESYSKDELEQMWRAAKQGDD